MLILSNLIDFMANSVFYNLFYYINVQFILIYIITY